MNDRERDALLYAEVKPNKTNWRDLKPLVWFLAIQFVCLVLFWKQF